MKHQPDARALAETGKLVRERLKNDPAAYRVPVEGAEIYAFGDFLDAVECDRLIAIIDDVAQPSQLLQDSVVSAYPADYRTSYSGDVDPEDSFVRQIERRICDLVGLEPSWGETVQGQRYYPGQEFRKHCDFFDTNGDYWADEASRGGQRSWTAMVYLNDVEAGGLTDFVNLGVTIPPQRGALLLWNNANLDGTPNHATMHAAQPVERGVKYVITKWFRTRPWG